MRPVRHFLLTLCFAAAIAPAHAAEAPAMMAGVPFERRTQVGGSELMLNGTGVRAVAWFKGYAAGLYLGARANATDAVVAMAGAKRIQLHMLRDVPAAEFVKALRDGMPRNSEAAMRPLLAERLERFAAMISAVGTVHDGDLINLDYEPGRGTLFVLNGKLRGEAIDGEDFYGALLRAFIGDHPYDEKLKAGLLGRGS